MQIVLNIKRQNAYLVPFNQIWLSGTVSHRNYRNLSFIIEKEH